MLSPWPELICLFVRITVSWVAEGNHLETDACLYDEGVANYTLYYVGFLSLIHIQF